MKGTQLAITGYDPLEVSSPFVAHLFVLLFFRIEFFSHFSSCKSQWQKKILHLPRQQQQPTGFSGTVFRLCMYVCVKLRISLVLGGPGGGGEGLTQMPLNSGFAPLYLVEDCLGEWHVLAGIQVEEVHGVIDCVNVVLLLLQIYLLDLVGACCL